jgi:hypothetical protein
LSDGRGHSVDGSRGGFAPELLELGEDLSLFLTMPYGKFVHGIYPFAALVRYADECNAIAHARETDQET